MPDKAVSWNRRTGRHLALAAIAVLVVFLVYLATPPPDVRHRLSMGTAYAGLGFLAYCFLLGPLNILRRRRNPISFDLRRDIGIWAGILALVHTTVGLTVHLRGRMWMYFVQQLHPLVLQKTGFGFANFTGLAAGAVFLMLLAISNDWSLRALGSKRWKSSQRWAYAAFGLTFVHGIAYQLVENRRFPWVLLLAALTGITATFQVLAFVRIRTRSSKDSDLNL